jgi:hypothetical protein
MGMASLKTRAIVRAGEGIRRHLRPRIVVGVVFVSVRFSSDPNTKTVDNGVSYRSKSGQPPRWNGCQAINATKKYGKPRRT